MLAITREERFAGLVFLLVFKHILRKHTFFIDLLTLNRSPFYYDFFLL